MVLVCNNFPIACWHATNHLFVFAAFRIANDFLLIQKMCFDSPGVRNEPDVILFWLHFSASTFRCLIVLSYSLRLCISLFLFSQMNRTKFSTLQSVPCFDWLPDSRTKSNLYKNCLKESRCEVDC